MIVKYNSFDLIVIIIIFDTLNNNLEITITNMLEIKDKNIEEI